MILKVDASQIEWRSKVFLSQDRVGIEELLDKADIHSDNQKKFGLPERRDAKFFVFRMIFANAFSEMGFRRPAYAYVHDPKFNVISSSLKYWERTCAAFFEKYEGMYAHGWALLDEVRRTGRIVNPTGREFTFSYKKNKRGEPELPVTHILNNPVQSLATADLMTLARVVLWKRFLASQVDLTRVLLNNTVHDSIEADVDLEPQECYNIMVEMEKVFEDLPELFERYFGVPFNVPLAGEVSYGPNLASLTKFDRPSFLDTFTKEKQEECASKSLALSQ